MLITIYHGIDAKIYPSDIACQIDPFASAMHFFAPVGYECKNMMPCVRLHLSALAMETGFKKI